MSIHKERLSDSHNALWDVHQIDRISRTPIYTNTFDGHHIHKWVFKNEDQVNSFFEEYSGEYVATLRLFDKDILNEGIKKGYIDDQRHYDASRMTMSF